MITTSRIGMFDLVLAHEFESSVWWTLLLNSSKVSEGCSRDDAAATREAIEAAVAHLRTEAARLEVTL